MIAAARYSVHVIQPILWVNWLALAGSFCCYCTAVHDLETNWRSRIARFPLFLVLSIGMSGHNTRAALEGIFGKKSPFERTPKYRVVGRAQDRAMSRYRSRARYSVVGECVLGGVSLVSVACAIYLGQYAAVPFQMLFVAGYGLVLMYSIRHMPVARGEIRAADTPGSVPPRGASRPQPASTAASPSVA
jgi:hypothetical protein